MSANVSLIMLKPTAADFLVNKIFSDISAAAIHYGFTAIEVRGITMRWLVIEAPLRVLPNISTKTTVCKAAYTP